MPLWKEYMWAPLTASTWYFEIWLQVDLQVSDDYKEIPEIVISNSRFDVEKAKQKLFVSKKNTEGSSEN